MTVRPGNVLPSLNGLRAFSILIVILSHLSLNFHLFGDLNKIIYLKPVLNIITDGNFGVNVFFVISGFLITTLLINEYSKRGEISFKNFYIRRTLRIFPAYFFMLFVYFILQLSGYIYISGASWLTALTYTKYFNWSLDWYTAHAWSLSIEEHFYLLWPFVFTLNRKTAIIVCWAMIIMVPCLKIFTSLPGLTWLDHYFNSLTIFKRIDSIALGCLFAMHKESIIEYLEKKWDMVIFISASCILLLYTISALWLVHFNEYLLIMFRSFFGSLANISIALIMMYSIFGPRNLWHKMLNLKFINFIGLLSYSLYLWQQLFLHDGNSLINQFPLNIFLLIMAALFSYYVIEKPFLSLKAKFSSAI